MYTRDYAAFCERYGGRFIHHEPNDRPGHDQGVSARDTVAFMEEHELPFDRSLWAGAAGCNVGGSGCGSVDCDNGGGPGNGNCTCS
jgi:hypothetical protein